MHVSIMMVIMILEILNSFYKELSRRYNKSKKCIEFVVIGGSFEILKRLAANGVC